METPKNSGLNDESLTQPRVESRPLPKPRLSAAARIILFILSIALSMFVFQTLAVVIFGIDTKTGRLPVTQTMLFITLGTVLTAWLFRRFFDRRSFGSLGFSIRGRSKDVLAGLLLAVCILGAGSLILMLTGNISFSAGQPSGRILVMQAVFFLCVSLSEELICRGYILNNLMDVMNRYAALAIASALFALAHVFNPGVTWLGMVNLFLAGILLGSTYIFTRNLWFPLSLHFFWNFIQGPVLGYKVSGAATASLLSVNTTGPDLMTGGAFGFEASLVNTVLTVLASYLIVRYYRRFPDSGYFTARSARNHKISTHS